MSIETLRVLPPSKIRTWAGWPEDVVEKLHEWNKAKRLSFVYLSRWGEKTIFKCVGCHAWHESGATVAVLDSDAYCDPCLITLARAASNQERAPDA